MLFGKIKKHCENILWPIFFSGQRLSPAHRLALENLPEGEREVPEIVHNLARDVTQLCGRTLDCSSLGPKFESQCILTTIFLLWNHSNFGLSEWQPDNWQAILVFAEICSKNPPTGLQATKLSIFTHVQLQ